MHSFARRFHGSKGELPAKGTTGLVLKGGWRYDLMEWGVDTFTFRGQLRALRQRTIVLAGIQPGEQVLDVGCGTGTLALLAQEHVGPTGHVTGVDPGTEQIARARAKAAQQRVPVDFQPAVIEHLPFADQVFDVVLSTLVMHHLPAPLKRQGLSEIARVLKPGGRLVIADFKPRSERAGQAARFHAGGSRIRDLTTLIADAGLRVLETVELPPLHFSAFPGAAIVRAVKSGGERHEEKA